MLIQDIVIPSITFGINEDVTMTTLHGGFFVQSCFVRASGHFLYASTQLFSSFDELANG